MYKERKTIQDMLEQTGELNQIFEQHAAQPNLFVPQFCAAQRYVYHDR